MANFTLIVAILVSLTSCITSAPAHQTEAIDLLMPKVQPQNPDTYLCTAMKVEDAHRYITGFIPKADTHIAHHILLYGCAVPGQMPGSVWNCGEMAAKGSDYEAGPTCQEGNNIVYAWAMEAPRLQLPPDVGFDVGQDTDIKYLVVQVHYKNVTKFLAPQNGDDSSGITLETTTEPTKKQAGVYLMATGGYISPHTIEYFETACPYQQDTEIVPFAYRTHAHTLGRVISGYRIRDGIWTEIGRKDPRLPEMFYNATNPGMTIKNGDILAARCTMENNLDHVVAIGNTQNDEMCNFYIMYYTNEPAALTRNMCGSQGPPSWYWTDYEDDSINIDNRPKTASVIPGTDKPLIRGPISGYDNADAQKQYDDNLVDGVLYDDKQKKAIQDMNGQDLLSLIQSVAREEEEEELARQSRDYNVNARW